MQRLQILFLLSVLGAIPVQGYSQPVCIAAPLSDQQVKDIIDKERIARSDLPAPFPKYQWDVKRDKCYYIYIEYGLPMAPEYNHIFMLSQHGVIVDVMAGG